MRKPRILKDRATYHVSAKINRGEHIFDSDEIKNLFMEIVKRAKKEYKFSIKNFVIMENHIHFLLEPIEIQQNCTLPRIMQWILSVFAINYNKMHKLKGHVWQGRYWSKVIDNIRQLFDTFNYISQNPVKADLVKNAEEYKYGGLYQILNKIFDIVDKPEYDFF